MQAAAKMQERRRDADDDVVDDDGDDDDDDDDDDDGKSGTSDHDAGNDIMALTNFRPAQTKKAGGNTPLKLRYLQTHETKQSITHFSSHVRYHLELNDASAGDRTASNCKRAGVGRGRALQRDAMDNISAILLLLVVVEEEVVVVVKAFISLVKAEERTFPKFFSLQPV
jgi:hypothetical protein